MLTIGDEMIARLGSGVRNRKDETGTRKRLGQLGNGGVTAQA